MIKKIRGYIENIRVYSLVDLVLLLYAAGAQNFLLIGAISLWLSFLFYLEWRHKHAYRSHQHTVICIFLGIIGIILFPFPWSLGFIISSLLYSEKQKKYVALLSPFFRGIQTISLLIPLISLTNPFIWIAAGAITLRNIIGDMRDAKKDADEDMYTIPVTLGLKKNIPYIHLIGVMSTTLLWWSYSDISFIYVPLVWLIQLVTYNITPR